MELRLHHEMLDTSVLPELIDSICVNWCPFSDLFPSSSVGPAPTHYGWIDGGEDVETAIFLSKPQLNILFILLAKLELEQ